MSAAAGSIRRGRPRGLWAGRIFLAFLVTSLAIGFLTLGALLAQVFLDGYKWVDAVLFFEPPSADPLIAGARPAILATIYLGIIIIVLSVPLGVGTAIYLEEYANRDRWYNRMLEVNIQNLAAVPSIVYGILGLAFIVRGPLDIGFVVLAGSMTLSLLVLPTVIIAAREAIRAVPPSIREGSLALGATEWQTICRQVLPASIPGIATGVILAVSRAIGETAPLLLVGAAAFVTFNPSGFSDRYTVLPVQIFNYFSRAQAEYIVLAAAGIIVMLILLLAMNSFAIWLRNRYEQKW
jgi:phosphate transport system permease protein